MTYSSEVLADSPAWYLRLGQSSGTSATDSSGNGRNGNLSGDVTWGAAGALLTDSDTAATFGGTNGNIVVPYVSSDNTSNRTIELWFKTNQARYIYSRDLSGGAKNMWFLVQSGKLQVGYYDYAGTAHNFSSATTINDLNWHHAVCVMTGMNDALPHFDLYIDGVLDAQYDGPVKTPTQANTVQNVDHYIGTRRNVAYFIGVLDEVAYYTSALSSARVAAHYAAATSIGPVPPVADFNFTPNGLSVFFDASISTDDNDDIVSWDWDFGDGNTGTGETTNHSFASSGTYTVELTVTDSADQTDTISHDVIVSDSAFASDTFARTVASGWGTADIGGPWRSTTLLSVDGSTGVLAFTAAGQGATPSLDNVSVKNMDLSFDMKISQIPSAGPLYLTPHMRGQTTGYKPKMRIQSGDINLQWTKNNGSDVNIDSGYTQLLSGVPDGAWVRYKFRVDGDNPAQLKGKAWLVGDAEPDWIAESTDTDAALISAGPLSIEFYLSGSAGAAPTINVDNLLLTAPTDVDQKPVATVTGPTNPVEPWQPFTLTFNESDDGTIATRTFRQISGTTVSISQPTGDGDTVDIDAPGTIAGDTLVFGYKVNDGTQDSDEDTISVDVLPVTERIVIGGVEVPARLFIVTT